MKICHLTTVHQYNDIRIFVKECQSLATIKQFDVHLIAPDAPNEIVNGVHLHGIKKAKNRLSRMTTIVWNLYKLAKHINADIYHFHDPELIPVAVFLKLSKKKVIYDVHENLSQDILSKEWIPKLARRSISKVVNTLEKYSSRLFDGVVTSTPQINEIFLKYGCNSININNFPIIKEFSIVKKINTSIDSYVCYVGGVTNIRGIFHMIDALNYTNVKLFLAGRFLSDEERINALKKKRWEQVVELGFLNRKEVNDTLNKSIAGLVLLHPIINFIDAWPVKMFEYMAAGIPVIASNFPLWEKIMEENYCGFCVDPLKPKEIGKAIQWIADNPKEAKRMGENGRKAVEQKYNWQIEFAKLYKFYEELAS